MKVVSSLIFIVLHFICWAQPSKFAKELSSFYFNIPIDASLPKIQEYLLSDSVIKPVTVDQKEGEGHYTFYFGVFNQHEFFAIQSKSYSFEVFDIDEPPGLDDTDLVIKIEAQYDSINESVNLEHQNLIKRFKRVASKSEKIEGRMTNHAETTGVGRIFYKSKKDKKHFFTIYLDYLERKIIVSYIRESRTWKYAG